MIDVQRADFVGVPTQDLERAVRFYGETLGLPRNELSSDEWPEFVAGELTILLTDVAKTGQQFRPNLGAIALRVPDVAAAKAKLEEEGVRFDVEEIYDSSVCHMAFFHDPDGNALMLHRRYAPYADGSQP